MLYFRHTLQIRTCLNVKIYVLHHIVSYYPKFQKSQICCAILNVDKWHVVASEWPEDAKLNPVCNSCWTGVLQNVRCYPSSFQLQKKK